MGAVGVYSEKLPCGGTLEVTAQGFRIHYYFPGPDMRHNGTLVDVPGAEVEAYMNAFAENWREFQQLKASIPVGGQFQRAGRKGMQIRIGPFREGVCLEMYHMPIRTEAELQSVIGSYRYALQRAAQAQALLQRL